MAKKCIPGVLCLENMTIFLLFVIILLCIYVYFNITKNQSQTMTVITTPTVQTPLPPVVMGGISTRSDPFNDPYFPPLKRNGYFDIRPDIIPVSGIPINMQTRGFSTDYTQIGILTKPNGDKSMILPLMGRRTLNGRDKWQYYTISNTGNVNTKLPIRVNGRNCIDENGCNEIINNDTVYVEGYKETFIATIYETGSFSYIPYI
jgi:hypothetical protein